MKIEEILKNDNRTEAEKLRKVRNFKKLVWVKGEKYELMFYASGSIMFEKKLEPGEGDTGNMIALFHPEDTLNDLENGRVLTHCTYQGWGFTEDTKTLEDILKELFSGKFKVEVF